MDLVSRVKGILLNPKHEWTTIDGEPATAGSLYTGYIVPLAAIPAISGFIGMSIIGLNVLGTAFRWPISSGIEWAVTRYVLSLVSVYVLALIIDALAPTFGGEKNLIQALKVATYSMTAAWVAGVFAILPVIGILTILGLYSLYLLYLGLPVLMKAPAEKAAGYTMIVIVCGIVLAILVSVLTRQVFPMSGPGAMTL